MKKEGNIRYLQSLMDIRVLKNEHDLRVWGSLVTVKKTPHKTVIKISPNGFKVNNVISVAGWGGVDFSGQYELVLFSSMS